MLSLLHHKSTAHYFISANSHIDIYQAMNPADSSSCQSHQHLSGPFFDPAWYVHVYIQVATPVPLARVSF